MFFNEDYVQLFYNGILQSNRDHLFIRKPTLFNKICMRDITTRFSVRPGDLLALYYKGKLMEEKVVD